MHSDARSRSRSHFPAWPPVTGRALGRLALVLVLLGSMFLAVVANDGKARAQSPTDGSGLDAAAALAQAQATGKETVVGTTTTTTFIQYAEPDGKFRADLSSGPV